MRRLTGWLGGHRPDVIHAEVPIPSTLRTWAERREQRVNGTLIYKLRPEGFARRKPEERCDHPLLQQDIFERIVGQFATASKADQYVTFAALTHLRRTNTHLRRLLQRGNGSAADLHAGLGLRVVQSKAESLASQMTEVICEEGAGWATWSDHFSRLKRQWATKLETSFVTQDMTDLR